jgi:hypothetical protein
MKLIVITAAATLMASSAFACPYSAEAQAQGGQSQIQAQSGQTQIPQTPPPATDKKS